MNVLPDETNPPSRGPVPDQTPHDLLAELSSSGVRVSAEGDRLRCQAPPGVLTGPLVERIQAHKQAILDVLRRWDEESPLSPVQEQLWLHHRLDPDDTAYHLPLELRLTGPVSASAVRFALGEVVRRHTVLRATFTAVDGEPRQQAHPHTRTALPLVDLSGLSPATRDTIRESVADAVVGRSFPLHAAPAHRTVLVRVGREQHDLLHTRHHIASDGASLGILARELSAHHAAATDGRPAAMPEPPVQFSEVARTRRAVAATQAAADRLAVARERLAGLTTTWDLLTPADLERRAADARAAVRHIDTDTAAAVRGLARELGATVFSIVATALGLAVTSCACQSGIVIGVPVTGRTRAEMTGTIGCFATVSPLGLDYSANPTFDNTVRAVHAEVGRAFTDHDLPVDRVIGRGRAEPYAVVLTQQDPPFAAPALGAATVEVVPLRTVRPKFPLAVTLAEDGPRYRLLAEYDPSRVAAATVGAVLDRLLTLLSVGIDQPGARCRTLTRFAAPRPPWPTPLAPDVPPSLGTLFAATARTRPDAVAVTDSRGSVTYRALHCRAQHLARALRAAGAGAETPVAVCVDHTAALAVALIGVALSGGFAVPLDPDDPAARHEAILTTSAARLLVVGERHEQGLRWFDGDVLVLDRTGATEREATADLPRVDARHLAYVIHTSGSTGSPKGVMITHANVVALFDAARRAHPFDMTGTWSLTHSSAFDFSVWELWGPLLHGGRVVVVPRTTARDPLALARTLRDERVTVHSSTPTAYQGLVGQTGGPPEVAAVVFGGERVEPAALDGRSEGGPELINMYGITETTVHVTCKRLSRDDLRSSDSPIGTPLPGVSAVVVDRDGAAVVPGGVGELLVGGPGVARGYLGAPGLTADRFRPVPGGGRAYRSGDRVRARADGELAHVGRLDQQVKLRGHRIEPAEVEAALLAHPDVTAAAVVHGVDDKGRDCLLAYLVAAPGSSPSGVALRRHTSGLLPPYMVPRSFTALSELPLTRNGKLDRRALPVPHGRDEQAGEPPATATETAIAGIWGELLGVPAIGRFDDFFALGGDSLLLTRMHARLNATCGVDLTLGEVYRCADLAALAAAVDRDENGGERP
ncbi:amino acid adenylation domain-containing protein [Actinokineospora guangxiensis]|uniref:Amino acid adenylation domain-containing protein n=1 Tax=Actinokineospora guangxiensis TaxID=1490288 RepID=A0ABW0EM88_9PSEU